MQVPFAHRPDDRPKVVALIARCVIDRREQLVGHTLQRRCHDDATLTRRVGAEQLGDIGDRGGVRERGAPEFVHDDWRCGRRHS